MAGRPRWAPTDEDRKLIRRLAGIGLQQSEIACLIDNPQTGKRIDVKTLMKNCDAEYREGQADANAKVANRAYLMAISGDSPAMTIFWLKTRMRWRETDRPGEDGDTPQAVTIRIAVDDDRG